MNNQSVPVQNPSRLPFSSFHIDSDKLLHSIIDVVCVIDEAGVFRYVSPSSLQLFGYTPGEMTGCSFLNFIHPCDVERTVHAMAEKIHDSRTSNFENRYTRKDGSTVHIIWSGRWDENEGLLYCVARDGSEKGDIQQRLLKAQHMARVANYEFDIARNSYTYTSDTLFMMFGLDVKKHPVFTSTLFTTLVHPDDLELVNNSLLQPEHLFNTTIEYRIIRPDGGVVYINQMQEVLRDAEGRLVKLTGTLQDITDRKIVELAVLQSEERFRSLVQNGNDLIGIIDTEGNYIFVGANVKEHLQFNSEDLVGTNAFNLIHPDDAAWVCEALQEITGRDTITIVPFRFKHGNGEWRWMETTVSNQLENPAIRGLVVNSKDITEKKQKEDELKRSEQQFKALVQNSSDLIVIIDERADFTYVSDNVTGLLGYAPAEMLGRNVLDFMNPADVQKVVTEFNALLHDDQKAKGVQHRFLHKSGEWVWLESKGSNHLHNQAIGGVLVNSRNIDDRVKLQDRLNLELMNKQKEIMAAVIKAQEAERSQLGLELHDNVNQILTTVKLYNELYLTGTMQDKELLVKSTQYTQECINEIRSISKRLSAPTLGKISLRDSVKELVDSINLTGRLEISYLPRNLDNCTISEDLHLAVYRIVQESLNNIIKYSQSQAASIEIVLGEKGLGVKIWDNGKGFDTSAKRLGIGITNMKTRAENLNATFDIKSAPGQGCQIEICFPLDDRAPANECWQKK